MSLGSDEIVYELLEKSGRLKDLQAVSIQAEQSSYSFISDKVGKVPFRVGHSPEALWFIPGDRYIAASYNRETLLEVVKKKKKPLLILDRFGSLKDIEKNIARIGRFIGEPAAAMQLIQSMQRGLTVCTRVKKPKVLIWTSTQIVPGDETIVNDLIQRAGGENVIRHIGWKTVSPEQIAILKPDLIMTSDSDPKLRSVAGWNLLDAAKNERIHIVNGRDLSSVSHHIVKAYEQILAILNRYSPCAG